MGRGVGRGEGEGAEHSNSSVLRAFSAFRLKSYEARLLWWTSENTLLSRAASSPNGNPGCISFPGDRTASRKRPRLRAVPTQIANRVVLILILCVKLFSVEGEADCRHDGALGSWSPGLQVELYLAITLCQQCCLLLCKPGRSIHEGEPTEAGIWAAQAQSGTALPSAHVNHKYNVKSASSHTKEVQGNR